MKVAPDESSGSFRLPEGEMKKRFLAYVPLGFALFVAGAAIGSSGQGWRG